MRKSDAQKLALHYFDRYEDYSLPFAHVVHEGVHYIATEVTNSGWAKARTVTVRIEAHRLQRTTLAAFYAASKGETP